MKRIKSLLLILAGSFTISTYAQVNIESCKTASEAKALILMMAKQEAHTMNNQLLAVGELEIPSAPDHVYRMTGFLKIGDSDEVKRFGLYRESVYTLLCTDGHLRMFGVDSGQRLETVHNKSWWF